MTSTISAVDTSEPSETKHRARPLKVFINSSPSVFTDHESHGEGLIAYSLASGLAERGHQVWVLAGRIAVSGQIHPNLHLAETGPHRIPFNSLSPSEYLAKADAYLKNLLVREKIDLVWRYYGGGTPRPPRAFGLPLVMGPLHYSWPKASAAEKSVTGGKSRFGIGLGAIAERVYERGHRAALASADLLICETEPHAATMRQRYPQAIVGMVPLIVTIPETTASVPMRTLRSGGNRTALRLLFVANLFPNKRAEVFCRTIGVLRARHGIDAQGVILGDGPERAALGALCTDSPEIGDAVEFRGKVPNAEVYEAVGAADFFVSTSIGEPYGRAIVEAMAMGTPPVCHRSGGPGDFIENGRTGLLVDTMSPDAYADAIAVLSRDSDRWAAISANARDQASTEWTREAVLLRVENLFRAVCDRAAPL